MFYLTFLAPDGTVDSAATQSSSTEQHRNLSSGMKSDGLLAVVVWLLLHHIT